MVTRKRSHTELTLKHTVKLIKAADSRPKSTQEELTKRFGIGRSTVSNILRKRAIYLQSWEDSITITLTDFKRKRIKQLESASF